MSANVWLPTRWYRLLLVISILLSVLGFILAAVFNKTSDGGLGGAFSVALSFGALWVREDLSEQFAHMTSLYPPEIDGRGLNAELDQVRKRIDDLANTAWLRSQESRRQNVNLAFASIVGTISWALGEHVACLLRNLF